MEPVDIAISPCPNDTFIFGHMVRPGGFPKPVELHFADVEELNRRAIEEARHKITKLSFHAMLYAKDRYSLLAPGGALGRGCGPILVAPKRDAGPPKPDSRILVPGRWTTAHLLVRLFLAQTAPDARRVEHGRYDRIIPALLSGEADYGVIIHEERFTYQARGLFPVQDLGEWWEKDTGFPIPLGAIALRKDQESLRGELEEGIVRSIHAARNDFHSIERFVKEHSQSLEDDVIQAHIGLYVNDFSVDPGTDGRRAIQELFARAERAGALPE